jgi:hypothetical protein
MRQGLNWLLFNDEVGRDRCSGEPWWHRPAWLFRIVGGGVAHFAGVFWPSPSRADRHRRMSVGQGPTNEADLPWELREEID